jgi:integral membrane sensor domain MASE1
MKTLLRFGAVLAGVLATAPRALAQGCAMCYADAAAQSPRARHQLDLAILTLLLPSVLLFAGVLFAAFRRREHDLTRAEQQAPADTPASKPAVPEKQPRLVPGPTPENA